MQREFYLNWRKKNDYLKICKSLNSDTLQNCKSINYDSGSCLECNTGYYFSSQDKKCILEKNCEKSFFGNCLYCNYGYYLNKKQLKCIKIESDFFSNCKISDDGTKCDECVEDYFLDQKGKCVYSNYCEEGQTFNCEKCREGYYLTSFGGVCTTEKNCYNGRKDIGVCTECDTNYYIDFKDGKCKSNQEDNDLKYCRIADGECKECDYGKYLAQDKKCTISINCQKSDKGKCLKCEDNFYLGLDNKCTNIEHCIYSDEDFSCIECEGNLYFDQNSQKCKIAEGNFENCKYGYENQYCQKCKDGFYINQIDNLCYKNTDKNEFYKCEISNGKFCIQCIDKYYLGYVDHKCSKIQFCDIIENEERCLVCSENFCLDSKNGFCKANYEIIDLEQKFYYKCNKTNSESTACQTCIEDYELRNGLCFDKEHCVERNEDGTCKKCQKNDYEFFEQCLNNDFGCVEVYYNQFCLECNNLTNLGECTKCMNGYHLDNNNICIEN